MPPAAGWRRRVELLVELGLRGAAGGSFQWDVSDWDEGAGWSGVEPTWVALEPSEVESVRTARGRRSGAERNRTGTATVVLVWEAPGDRWIFRPTTPVSIGQELRLRARIDGSPDLVPIYRGGVRDVVDDWDPDGPYRVRINLSDRKADLAAVDLPERAVEGLGDLTDERLERILGLANISTFYARFGTGLAEHQSSNFARNLLDEAEVAVEGEVGEFYVDREGFLVFVPRGWYQTEPRSSVAAMLTWTNVVGDPEAAVPTGKFQTGQSLGDLVNQVSMARAGGSAYTAGPDASYLTYGLRTYQRFDLTLRYDADVEIAADYRLEQLKDRTSRVEALTSHLNPRATAAAIRKLIDVELLDAHEVIWDDGSGLDPFEEVYHVQGVNHSITMDDWSVSVNLWHIAGFAFPAHWSVDLWDDAQWS